MNSDEKRKLKGWIKVLIVALVILLILIGGYFGFNKIFNDPYKVYTGLVNEVFDSAINYTEETYNNSVYYPKDSKIKLEYNLNMQSSLEKLKGFEDYKYGMNFAYDTKTKDIETKINVNNKDNNPAVPILTTLKITIIAIIKYDINIPPFTFYILLFFIFLLYFIDI